MTQESVPHLVQNREVAFPFDQGVVHHDYTPQAKLQTKIFI
jgi:hypothetical protein